MFFTDVYTLAPPPAFQPPVGKCQVLILTSLMWTNGNKIATVNRITQKTTSYHQKERRSHKVLTVSFAKCIMGNSEYISSKKSWKVFSKKRKKAHNIIVGIYPTQPGSQPTLATLFCHMQEKAFASAESSCFLLTIRCTGTESI